MSKSISLSTTGAPLPSDSSSVPPIPPQYHGQSMSSTNEEGRMHWWQKPETVIAIMGMALTGVIGYFSAVLPLKDSISSNTSKINVIEEQIKNIDWKLTNTNNDISKIHLIEKDVAVLQTKVESNSKDIEKNTRK